MSAEVLGVLYGVGIVCATVLGFTLGVSTTAKLFKGPGCACVACRRRRELLRCEVEQREALLHLRKQKQEVQEQLEALRRDMAREESGGPK